MLRHEKGFADSIYSSADADIRGYTNHHRLLVPALIAPDIYNAGHSAYASKQKLELVLDGTLRSSTLAFESENVKRASENLGWIGIKDEIQIDEDIISDWRITRRDDPHFGHPGINAWSATRNLLKLPHDAATEHSTRVRERYTFTARENYCENDIRAILCENDAPDDIMLATATVYAINKLVPKPQIPHFPVDMSRFPAVSATMHRS